MGRFLVPIVALAVAIGSVVGFLAFGGDDEDEPRPRSAAPAQSRTEAELPEEEVLVQTEPRRVGEPLPEEPEPPLQKEKLVPRDLEVTSERVKRVFQRAVVRRGREGQVRPKLLSIRCVEGSCVVRYRADGPGTGRLLEHQGPIWRELFSNPRVKEATLIADVGGRDVHGLGLGPPGGKPPVVVRCDAAELRRIRRIGVGSAPDVKRLCKVEAKDVAGR